jgi:hypothetical protein
MEDILLFYAELDENNIVTQVAVIAEHRSLDSEGNINDELAQDFCRRMYGGENRWIRTWDDANKDIQKRFEYAGPGMQYDPDFDIFYGMPYDEEWVFNTETLKWDPPAGAPEKPQLTSEESEKNYQIFWSAKKWKSGENPWIKRRVPTTLPPDLTSEEISAHGTYFWVEETDTWEIRFPTLPKPELTEEKIKNNVTDHYWNVTEEKWEELFN